MALLPRAFDPTTTRPHVPGGGGLPIGEYLAVVVSNTLKPTKGNTGGYAEFTFRVVEGEFTSVTQAYRLNLINQNPETVRIAEEQLSALCHATGNGGQAVQDLDVLNNIPMILVIGPQKEQEPGKPVRTEVKGVRPYTGVAPAGAAMYLQIGKHHLQLMRQELPMQLMQTVASRCRFRFRGLPIAYWSDHYRILIE